MMKTTLSLVLMSFACVACKRPEETPASGSRPVALDSKPAGQDGSETAVAPAKNPGEASSKPAVSTGQEDSKAAQDKPEKSEEAAAQNALAKFHAALKQEGIKIDLAKRTLTLPVVVNRPTNDLEFLLIHRQGKAHEALLVTECTPSILNSGLMALGVPMGKNASFKKKDPMPSEDELRAGADPYILVPPSGGRMYMTVSFEGKDGKQVVLPVEELLLDWMDNVSVADNQWVYLGGRMAQMYRGDPEVFMADYEGNLISVCYKHPNNHLLTMVHERARDEMNWAIAPSCPAPGTEIALTFHRHKPKIIAEREARVAKRAKGDLKSRPNRNPAREGGGAPLPSKKKNK
jgi:hypothetical protein